MKACIIFLFAVACLSLHAHPKTKIHPKEQIIGLWELGEIDDDGLWKPVEIDGKPNDKDAFRMIEFMSGGKGVIYELRNDRWHPEKTTWAIRVDHYKYYSNALYLFFETPGLKTIECDFTFKDGLLHMWPSIVFDDSEPPAFRGIKGKSAYKRTMLNLSNPLPSKPLPLVPMKAKAE